MLSFRALLAFWLGLTESESDVTAHQTDDLIGFYDAGRALGRKLLGLP